MSDIAINDFTYLQEYADFISKEEFWNDVILQLNKDLNKALVKAHMYNQPP